MTASRSAGPAHGRPPFFRFSLLALAVLLLGAALATIPLRRADVALLGLIVIWIGLYLFMRQAGPTLRYWATMMAAGALWLILVSVSGSMALWSPKGETTAVRAEPAKVIASGAELRADVRVAGEQLQISNRGQQPWQDIDLSLNGAPNAGGYRVHMDRVAAGRTITVMLSRFVGAKGQTFDVSHARPQSLAISARLGESGQTGAYEVRWQ